MNKSSGYISNFEQWVDAFINKFELFTKDQKLLVLVSGGADSLSLLHCLVKLNYNVCALYFHHGTRMTLGSRDEDEHQIEMAKIQKVLGTKGEFFVEHLANLSLTDSNFENKARVLRRDVLKKKYQDYLWITGHHLDDSFEWWLRGRLTQNHPDFPLGIPVANGNYRRPFLAVSRKHIERYINLAKISFHHDSSNNNEKFERNFLRQNVIASLKIRYPKYLRHYVQQSLIRANRLGVLRSGTVKHSPIKKLQLSENLWFLKLDNASSIDEILNFLKTHSSIERGYLVKSLVQFYPQKIDLKTPLKGPMSFSGSLHLWQWRDCFFLWHSRQRPTKVLTALDQYLELNVSDIHYSLQKSIHLLDIMGLKLENKIKNPRSLKSEVRFFKLICPVFYKELRARQLFVSHL